MYWENTCVSYAWLHRTFPVCFAGSSNLIVLQKQNRTFSSVKVVIYWWGKSREQPGKIHHTPYWNSAQHHPREGEACKMSMLLLHLNIILLRLWMTERLPQTWLSVPDYSCPNPGKFCFAICLQTLIYLPIIKCIFSKWVQNCQERSSVKLSSPPF